MENNSALLIMDIQGRMVDGLANKEEYLQKRLFRNSDGRESGVPEASGHQV